MVGYKSKSVSRKVHRKIDEARETIDVCLPYPPGPDEFESSGVARGLRLVGYSPRKWRSGLDNANIPRLSVQNNVGPAVVSRGMGWRTARLALRKSGHAMQASQLLPVFGITRGENRLDSQSEHAVATRLLVR